MKFFWSKGRYGCKLENDKKVIICTPVDKDCELGKAIPEVFSHMITLYAKLTISSISRDTLSSQLDDLKASVVAEFDKAASRPPASNI